MLNYILISCAVLFVLVIIYAAYKIAQLRTELAFLRMEADKYAILYSENELKREEQLLQIQSLQDKLTRAEADLANFSVLQEKALAVAKTSLFDLGNELSKKLLEEHKRENQDVKRHAEHELNRTSQKFHEQFERISNLVSVLSKDLSESKESADLIKRSLLSPSSSGSLAEMTLENMLKNMQLRAGIDFKIQYEIKNETQKLRPDAVVYLPHNNLMVIDAKASKFLVEIEHVKSSTDKKNAEASLIKTMHIHLKSLASKEYAHNLLQDHPVALQHVITLMFLPSEHAIDKIAALDPEFMKRAWSNNIYPVGPTGLMNLLSFAKFQITDHLRSANSQQIITEVEKLMDATSILVEHADKMGNNLTNTLNYYDKFAASFNRNFLSKANNIQKLGVKTQKQNKPIHALKRYMLVSTSSDMIDLASEQEAISYENEENN